uniref:Uncharacterized protein n=1 Tax=Lactuca sativa TaxID=4236 RepID=A0A9R1W1Z4_LACSA|nr:hypothetical protein LSAT_V11C300154660 [Lactuca sativa]
MILTISFLFTSGYEFYQIQTLILLQGYRLAMMTTNKLKFNTNLFSILLCTFSLEEARRPMDGKLIGYNTDCDAFITAIEVAL